MSKDKTLPPLDEDGSRVVAILGMEHPVSQALMLEPQTVMIHSVLLAIVENFQIELDYLRSEVEKLEDQMSSLQK